ncbi:RDD family protein [Vulcaniibacterium tengchongense]|uniref:Putative RDD family membrane protein YckC n=1 Tax=Vulcaniibacterium tengchongense TaxID=1273429 RepID=A0A3N4VKX8_9GAMM|nr:RDD family protein [Vulcaniibacterium tengchongense]RPE79921.1 putative RDD family membrane protein YckC [Vulcaniibacterium tengchongense]
MDEFEFRNPYAAPAAPVQAPPRPRAEAATAADAAEAGEVPVRAGRLPRLLAQLADGAIALAALAPALLLLTLLALVALAIWQLVLLAREGQTLGKRWVGIRIVRSDYSRARLARIFWLRGVVPGVIGQIPYLGPAFGLANVLWIFGVERRCLHDYIADTLVVNA